MKQHSSCGVGGEDGALLVATEILPRLQPQSLNYQQSRLEVRFPTCISPGMFYSPFGNRTCQHRSARGRRTNRRGVAFGRVVKYLLHHSRDDTVSEGRLYCVTTDLVYGARKPQLVMKHVCSESCGRNARYRPPKRRTLLSSSLWRPCTCPNIYVRRGRV